MGRRRLFVLGYCVVALLAMTATVWAEGIMPQQKPTTTDPIAQHETIAFRPSNSDKPLNNRELENYRLAFKYLNSGDTATAQQFIDKIDNPLLIGHVMYRWLQKTGKNTTTHLQQWAKAYPDHPQADTIAPDDNLYENRITGTMDELRYFARGSKYISEKYNGGQRYEVNLVKKEVRRYLDRGAATAALNFFINHRAQKYIDPVDKSQILADIASVYLYLGHNKKAKDTAQKALDASDLSPLAGWVMGLVSWMNEDYKKATGYFTMASNTPYASPWMTAAAAYWGARAATRSDGDFLLQVTPLLARAVTNQRTFYGLLATKALGYGYDFNWTMPDYTKDERLVLIGHPAGARAVALAEIEEWTLAEAELFALPVKNKPDLAEAAIAFANHYNLAGYAMRYSLAMPNPAGGYYDAGLFPVSSWTKQQDTIDPALMNAFIRQESRFRTTAQSPTGAIGLMQLMPDTAAYIAEDDIYKTSQGQKKLLNPAINTTIGAKYLDHLSDLEAVDNDLFGLAIAYNAGPGKLRRWKKEIKNKDRDSLLFIELIPASETRAFVERVLTNYWIYQMQMGIDPASLTAVASGQWPKVE